jgi:RNA polymerase sigma factor for flagellar operon FliA
MISDQAELSEHWKKYQHMQDPAARVALVNNYLPLVETLAAMAYARRVNDALSYQDMLHYGMTGLLEALERYLPNQGADFKTYASFRIKGAIYDGLARATEVSSQVAARKTRVRARAESLRSDTQDILGKLIEQSIGLAIGFMLDDTNMYQVHPDQPSADDVAYQSYELRELTQQLASLLTQLSADQQQIIQLHYFQHIEFIDIAVLLKLSRSRISQLHKEALFKLRCLYQAQ